MDYELELGPVFEQIKDRDHRKVVLQFPEGLRDAYEPVVAAFEKATQARIIVSADASYGACDLADDEAAKVGADALVHFGHTQIPHMSAVQRLPVYFVSAQSVHDVRPVVERALKHLVGPRVGLLTTTQHTHAISDVASIVTSAGLEPVVRAGDARLTTPGQVLGCNYTSVDMEADSFLFVGSGDFHPLGLALNTGKPVIVADPYSGQVRDMGETRDKFLKQRYGAISSVRDASSWGVVASSKDGQLRWNMAVALRKRLEAKGLKAVLILLKQIGPEHLVNFRHLDAFVSTACPRIAIDDYARYAKPMLTPFEMEMALGDRPLDEYRLDEIYASSI